MIYDSVRGGGTLILPLSLACICPDLAFAEISISRLISVIFAFHLHSSFLLGSGTLLVPI